MSETLVETPIIPARRFNINSENARALWEKGQAAKKAKELARKQEHAKLEKLAEIGLNSLDPSSLTTGDKFRDEALLRTRNHLTRLQDKIDDLFQKRAFDVKGMRDLATSIKELEGVEARLSNRPAPGNLRPVAQKPAKTRSSYPEPQPQFTQISEPIAQTTPQQVVVDPFSEVQAQENLSTST